jgi:hypothetical protein
VKETFRRMSGGGHVARSSASSRAAPSFPPPPVPKTKEQPPLSPPPRPPSPAPIITYRGPQGVCSRAYLEFLPEIKACCTPPQRSRFRPFVKPFVNSNWILKDPRFKGVDPRVWISSKRIMKAGFRV